MKKSVEVLRYFLIGILIMAVMTFIGGSMAIYSDTLVNPWFPIVGAGAAAVACAPFCMRWWKFVTQCHQAWFNGLCHVMFTGSLLLFAFYFCNSYFASHDTAHMERVAIERRFRETHYKTKRISRRTYGRGEPYQQYYIEVRFEDGRTKKLSVKFDTYRRLKSQDTIQLKMERGLWGLPVIRRKGANIEVPHSGYRQTESILTRRLRESKY